MIRLDLECKTRTNPPINHCTEMLTRTLRSGAELFALPLQLAGRIPFFGKNCYAQRWESIYLLLAFVATKKEEMRLAGSSLTLISKEAFPMVDIVEQLVWRI
ncbi:hypothetical protein ZY05719_06240 [Streptococcus suis]|nr:hypothetical protein ZY05719_06240 [Streptococcus suis]